MVQVHRGDIVSRVQAFYPGKRMPFLCSFNRSSGWRILSENYEEHARGLRTEQFDINQSGGCENDLTCIAISENGITAIGSGAKDGCLYFIKDISAVKDIHSGARFMPLHKETLDAPIHSIDWSGNHLLVGTNQGITKLYNVEFQNDHLQDFTLIGQYINPSSEIALYFSSYIANTHVKAAAFSPSYVSEGINSVMDISRRFLTTTSNRLSVWDTLEQKAPVSRIYANEAPLSCASWSPNDAQSLIVCGGLDRKLVIVDTRISTDSHNGVVWSADSAHARPIRDAQFNPFIPYWLASAGEDSIVNIWDIRASYRAPVAKIDGNAGIVTSVTWSNIRPENIGTTASDGTMRYYTLSPEALPMWDTHYRIARYDEQDTLPIVRECKKGNIWFPKDQNYEYPDVQTWKTDMWDRDEYLDEGRTTMLLAGAFGLGQWGRPEPGTIYKGETTVKARGAVVKVIPSKSRPSMYYSITSGGQLTANIVRFDAASIIRNRHRFDPSDKDAMVAKIEDDIYCRRITDAQQGLEQLKNTPADSTPKERKRAEEVEFLEDCLKPRDPIKCTDWRFDSIPDKSSKRISCRLWNAEDMWEDAIQTFKKDLKYWSCRIPPGYNTKYKFPLEFTAPIIAPHLVEEEAVLTPLPHKKDDTTLDIEDNNERETIAGEALSTVNGTNEDQTEQQEKQTPEKDTKQPSIKNRRNMGHVPPIVTSHFDQDPNSKPSNPPLTPPQSANTGVATSSHPSALPISTNPFENGVEPQQSPTETPKSTNPFEISLPSSHVEEKQQRQQRLTNPFDYQPLPETPAKLHEQHLEDNRTTKSAQSQKSEKQHQRRFSWMAGSHNLGLTFSRRRAKSTYEGQSESGNRTPGVKRHHKFNPLKRFLSGDTDGQQQGSVSTEDDVITLQRKVSSRRNAMHGPF